MATPSFFLTILVLEALDFIFLLKVVASAMYYKISPLFKVDICSDIPGYPKTVKTGFRAGFLPTRDRPRPDFLKTGKTRKPTSKPRVPGGF